MCKDEEGNAQAMMILIRGINTIFIEYLVTNPINIRCAANDHEPKRVKGAGMCLIEMAVEIAMDENKASIDVCPLDSAIPFYEKCGFDPDPAGGMTILLPYIDDRTHPFIVA